VGHSLGGNVASIYAGVRPGRVARLVALDAFGLADTRPEQAPGRLEKWLSELATPAGFRPYPDFDALAFRLQADNPRLTPERAAFLAREVGMETATGEVLLAADPAHRRIHPILYRRQEVLACWRRVAASVLWLEPEETTLRRRLGVSDADYEASMSCFRHFRREVVEDAGHNLHHDQPEAVARIIEPFLLSDSSPAPRSESLP
jgi:pimeloyl-ACP methyl ester carboxylesterase